MEDSFIPFIENLLQKAANISQKNFRKFTDFSDKFGDLKQILTKTDIEISTLMVESIKATYPKHNIIDEETGVQDNGSPFTWVIDPIDGTSNYATGSPFYGNMIGILKNNKPYAGGIILPDLHNEIVLAQENQGCFIGNNKVDITNISDLAKVFIAFQLNSKKNDNGSFSQTVILNKLIQGFDKLKFRSGTIFDIFLVISGRYGAAIKKESKVWDNVALQILVEEAGGIWTDLQGDPINYSDCLQNPNKNYEYAAGNPQIQKQIIQILNN